MSIEDTVHKLSNCMVRLGYKLDNHSLQELYNKYYTTLEKLPEPFQQELLSRLDTNSVIRLCNSSKKYKHMCANNFNIFQKRILQEFPDTKDVITKDNAYMMYTKYVNAEKYGIMMWDNIDDINPTSIKKYIKVMKTMSNSQILIILRLIIKNNAKANNFILQFLIDTTVKIGRPDLVTIIFNLLVAELDFHDEDVIMEFLLNTLDNNFNMDMIRHQYDIFDKSNQTVDTKLENLDALIDASKEHKRTAALKYFTDKKKELEKFTN